jgi:Predicted transcriptional regulator
MNKLDRIMGMLLLLRDGRVVSATDLAARFEVSIRTVYRDIETLSALGVPVSAEMGRAGGFALGEGYFLPPITLGPEEAVSLLLGVTLMRRLRAMPFAKEAEMAERKLLAALPPQTREAMRRASRSIGFEEVPSDLLHPERADPQAGFGPGPAAESAAVGAFLKALLARSRVTLEYRSPYREGESGREVEPLGLVWDRDRWYLVGRPCDAASEAKERAAPRGAGSKKGPVLQGGDVRTWRADRVTRIGPGRAMPPIRSDFDARTLLDRQWLSAAMAQWGAEAPATIAMTEAQAELLRRDWYYGKARFEALPDGRVAMRYGEFTPEDTAALVRWLGPGAELVEPKAWRPLMAAGLREMLADYEDAIVPRGRSR